MIDVKPLTFKELFLSEIPIHPRVYESDFAYTGEFLDEVCNSLPDSMRKTLPEYELLFGNPREIAIEDDKIIYKILSGGLIKEIDFADFIYRCNSEDRIVRFGLNSSAIYLTPDEKLTLSIQTLKDHSMGLERIEQYSTIPEDEYFRDKGYRSIIFWVSHNLDTAPGPARLCFENFAIMFNNLGLERL